MNYNYHTHTYLCNHAEGTLEEYVLSAIEAGIVRMGFSDHMPYWNALGYEEGYRIPVDNAEKYIQEVIRLKEKYKDKIEILLGFEMEYLPGLYEDMLHKAVGYGAQYLICGEHRTTEPGEYSGIESCDTQKLTAYVDALVQAIKTGVFTYIAHPDLINFIGDASLYDSEMRRLCKASSKYGIPLEINFLGIRTNRHYPKDAFWKIAGEEKCPVTFGLDAHDAPSAGDRKSLSTAYELVEKFNLNYIGEPKIIYLNEK